MEKVRFTSNRGTFDERIENTFELDQNDHKSSLILKLDPVPMFDFDQIKPSEVDLFKVKFCHPDDVRKELPEYSELKSLVNNNQYFNSFALQQQKQFETFLDSMKGHTYKDFKEDLIAHLDKNQQNPKSSQERASKANSI